MKYIASGFLVVALAVSCATDGTIEKLDQVTRALDDAKAERSRLEQELTKARSLAATGAPAPDTSAVVAARMNDLQMQIEALKAEKAAVEAQADDERANGWEMGGQLVSSAGGSLLTMLGVPGGAVLASLAGNAMAGVAASKRRKENGNG